jgi:diacylglycerol kinase family enzyme
MTDADFRSDVGTSRGSAAPPWSRRLAAVVALVALASVVVYLTVEALSRWWVLLISVVALATAVIAVWYVLSRRGMRRAIAAAVAVVALAVFVVVVVASESLRVLIVGLVLGGLSSAAAGWALRQPSSPDDVSASVRPAKPRHPVLIMNLKSGGGKAERFRLVDECRERGIEPVVLTPGDDLEQLAEDAVARGADVLGMAGGDGSQALIASVASRHGIPLVVIPAGTRNHFALDLGLDRDDVVGALEGFDDAVEVVVDLAEVNGRVFVNNASLGVYAEVVQSADYRNAKVQTAAAMLPELIGPGATPLDLRFTLPSGEEASTAHVVLVSNNQYQLGHLRGAGTRERLDDGVLGIATVLITKGAGGRGQSARRNEWTATEFEVRSGRPLEIGVDGEALVLDPPLRFTVRPGALRVRRPRTAVGRSPAALAIRVASASTLAALARTALGLPVTT